MFIYIKIVSQISSSSTAISACITSFQGIRFSFPAAALGLGENDMLAKFQSPRYINGENYWNKRHKWTL